jgi:protein-tyrosine phosphatase
MVVDYSDPLPRTTMVTTTPLSVTDSAVAFLTLTGIDTIVSFNQVPYTSEEQARVHKAGIFYRHLPVEDFQPPSYEQLRSAVQLFNDRLKSLTLVHCGFGYGRTGTGITALQLFATWGSDPPEADWEELNHVETDDQKKVLRRIRSHYQGKE